MNNDQKQLNQSLIPRDSVYVNRVIEGNPVFFDTSREIQSRFAILSNINVKNFVQLSEVATAFGTVNAGATAFLATSLTPNPPKQNEVNYGDPYIAIYEGTAAISANQIYPTYGGSVTPGDWTIEGGLDYNGFATADVQTLSIWKGTITNNTGGALPIYLVSMWKWLQYNASTTR